MEIDLLSLPMLPQDQLFWGCRYENTKFWAILIPLDVRMRYRVSLFFKYSKAYLKAAPNADRTATAPLCNALRG